MTKGGIPMKDFEVIGTWWNDKTVPLARIDGEVYALSGWNGEVYGHCWKCNGEFFMDASPEEYVVLPTYADIEGNNFAVVGYTVA